MYRILLLLTFLTGKHKRTMHKYNTSFYIDSKLESDFPITNFNTLLSSVKELLLESSIKLNVINIKYLDLKYKTTTSKRYSKKLLKSLQKSHIYNTGDDNTNIIFYILRRGRRSKLRGLAFLDSARLKGENFGILYYTPSGFDKTIVHEILHTLNVKHNNKRGTESIMSEKFNSENNFIDNSTISEIEKYLSKNSKSFNPSFEEDLPV